MSDWIEFKQVGNKKQIMPPGYVMCFTGSHFMFIREKDELESVICWDKWTVYRWAWKHYKEQKENE